MKYDPSVRTGLYIFVWPSGTMSMPWLTVEPIIGTELPANLKVYKGSWGSLGVKRVFRVFVVIKGF